MPQYPVRLFELPNGATRATAPVEVPGFTIEAPCLASAQGRLRARLVFDFGRKVRAISHEARRDKSLGFVATVYAKE